MGCKRCFLAFMENKYKHCVLRLEVEKENEIAVHTYEKCGFSVLGYTEMKK